MSRQFFRNTMITGGLPQLNSSSVEHLFGGTGEDGAFAPGESYDFDDAEGSWVIKEYSSITINNGETISATNRIKGLILYCSGDVVINGEIDLDGKGYGSEQTPPIVFDRYLSSGVLTSAWAEYCASVRGGDGGGGAGAGYPFTEGPKNGGNGSHAGGSGAGWAGYAANSSFLRNGGSASAWTPGKVYAGGTLSGQTYWAAFITSGGALLANPFFDHWYKVSAGAGICGSGGAAYLGVQNAGGNSGQGGVGYGLLGSGVTNGTNATLTTGTKYGGSLITIIAKGTITLGATANIHSEGQTASNLSSNNGCDGGGGGGCIVLMSEGAQSIDGSATQSVDGGAGGTNSSYGGDGGSGDAGTIVNQQVA